jgi:hypothetical protein
VLTSTTGMMLATGGANGGITGAAGSGLAFGAVPATIWTNDNLTIAPGITLAGTAA